MSSEKNGPSETFSLDELKQASAEQPKEEVSKQAAPRERRTSSFIDDADSLLADIRDVVDNEVKSESERVTAERQAAIAARNTETELANAARRKAVEEKMAAEEARRRAVAEERELRRRTLAGEVIPEEEPPESVEDPVEVPAPAEKALNFPSVQSAAIESPTQKRRGLGFYIVAIGLPVLIAVGVVVSLDQEKDKKARVSTSDATPPKKTKDPAPSQGPVDPTKSPPGEVTIGTGTDTPKTSTNTAQVDGVLEKSAPGKEEASGTISKAVESKTKSSTQSTAKKSKPKKTTKVSRRGRKGKTTRSTRTRSNNAGKRGQRGRKGKKTKSRKRIRINIDEEGD